jgi:NAD(P)-dependent dehydrogenase (short-subunit alcohol dehydrogenase family)
MLNYQPSRSLLENKVILVTGAGDGIGRAAAITYAKYGAQVILLGRTVKKLESVYDEIIEAGYPSPAIVPMDLKGASEVHYQGLAETIEGQFGCLDGLLHNAAVLGALSPFEHTPKHLFDEVMQVNVTAQFQLTKVLLPMLKASPESSLVFTSSGVGRTGKAHWGAYSISKFATEGMMQVLADELDYSNIRINAINPGPTRTKMRESAFPAEDANQLPTPEDLMPLYLLLMGKDSRHIHGQSLDARSSKSIALKTKEPH